MKFFQVIPSGTKIDFIGKFKFFLTGSMAVVAVAIFFMFKVGFNYGIDFTGGTVFQVQFNQPQTDEGIRNILEQMGTSDASVVAIGTTNMQYMITSRADEKEALHKRFVEKVGATNCHIQQVDIVGPKVGKELRTSALLSLIYSIFLIMVYIWFRFDAQFAPGATIAIIHDIIISAGFYLLTGREFTITSIAALLTIAGYSVNDTIVIYDRVRELTKLGGDSMPLPQKINLAINQTLSRTMLTSFITLLSIVPISFFCTGEIQSFALAMIVGIFVGTYSTVYIAAPFTIFASKYVGKSTHRIDRTHTV